MPVIEEDGWTLWESNAIVQYLATRKWDAGLLPRDERARADVTRWLFWDSAHWDQACAILRSSRNFVKGFFGRRSRRSCRGREGPRAVQPRRFGARPASQGPQVRLRRGAHRRGFRDRRAVDHGGAGKVSAGGICGNPPLVARAWRRFRHGPRPKPWAGCPPRHEPQSSFVSTAFCGATVGSILKRTRPSRRPPSVEMSTRQSPCCGWRLIV